VPQRLQGDPQPNVDAITRGPYAIALTWAAFIAQNPAAAPDPPPRKPPWLIPV